MTIRIHCERCQQEIPDYSPLRGPFGTYLLLCVECRAEYISLTKQFLMAKRAPLTTARPVKTCE